jgi:hypothetical protein
MESKMKSSLWINMTVYKFDANELTDAELAEQGTHGIYDHVVFFLLVQPADQTIWLINGGSQVFEGGDTEFIRLPLQKRTPTTSVMQSDIEKTNAIEKQPKEKKEKRVRATTAQSKRKTSKKNTSKANPAKPTRTSVQREQIDLTGASEKPNVQKDDQSKDDGKRWQVEYPKSSKKKHVYKTHEDVVQTLRGMMPGHKIGTLLVVGSRKGCAIQRPAHTDTEPNSFGENDLVIPLSIFIGLQKETTIRVFEGSHRWIREHDGKSTLHKNDGKPVKYGRGDVLILRGDLVHQGDAFKQQNMRLFVYAHLPGHREELDEDGKEIMVTFPVRFDKDDESGTEEESEDSKTS